MEIMELAAQLGKAIRENEVYQNFLKAKEAYDHNDDLNRKIMEYGVQQRALQETATSPDRDDTVMDQIQKRIDALYDEICADESFAAVNAAQEAVNELMNNVNQTITFNITGETPCTHDCSTCGGCH